ncbi:hypothetical protein KM622_gp121 [Spodoptera exempta nucleopolyhedrovirus]|uniref:Uncharacterized protein n=1 Tax=Spodoptera exempta nucleopolyhedrovirus TaxID=1242863 RepID=A0A410S7V8_9ABAC|nr:hypothetical protein KM622_gp121 [Spodoptera exempta nucleopolyhedrovirus]QAT90407.1 hypothetical protein [Spodoptera exempta nucleopolyhedrovirus]
MFAFEHESSGNFISVYYDTDMFYFDPKELTALFKYYGGRIRDHREIRKLSKHKHLSLTQTLRFLNCYTKSYYVKKFIVESICPVLVEFKNKHINI